MKLVLMFLLMACAPNGPTSLEGSGTRWPTNHIVILDSTGELWRDPLRAAALQWGSRGQVSLELIPYPRQIDCAPTYSDGCCAGIPGMIHACSWEYPGARWAGLTNYRLAHGQIMLEAEVMLNDLYSRGDTERELLRLACHELGHALGLGHRGYGVESCLNEWGDYPYPAEEDFADLEIRYPR